MEQVGKTEIEQSATPEALYSAIEKYSAAPKDLSREDAYREARNALIRFRKVYSKLPALPDHQENAVVGLQEVMDWCIRAIDIVDHMVDDMDTHVVEELIRKLNKLRGLPALGFPKIHKDVLKKAEDRAQRIIDKYQAGRKPPAGISIHTYCRKRTKFLEIAGIISRLADVANRRTRGADTQHDWVGGKLIPVTPLSIDIYRAHTEMDFARSIERIYRLMDSDYTTALATLEKKIADVFEKMNRLKATDAGDLLQRYDELKGLKLHDRVVRLPHVYSINSLVDTVLFGTNLPWALGGDARETLVDEAMKTLDSICRRIKEQSRAKQSQNGGRAEGGALKMPPMSSKNNWEAIKSEYDISKKDFGKKINFVSDSFKRKTIFRDVEHAFLLASQGFSKPALILAGGVIEELLRLYLEHKKIQPKNKRFVDYITACVDSGLLKHGVSRLTDSIREFRNLVHLDSEKTKSHTVSKATAKGAVASIFTIANDFQKVSSN